MAGALGVLKALLLKIDLYWKEINIRKVPRVFSGDVVPVVTVLMTVVALQFWPSCQLLCIFSTVGLGMYQFKTTSVLVMACCKRIPVTLIIYKIK